LYIFANIAFFLSRRTHVNRMGDTHEEVWYCIIHVSARVLHAIM